MHYRLLITLNKLFAIWYFRYSNWLLPSLYPQFSLLFPIYNKSNIKKKPVDSNLQQSRSQHPFEFPIQGHIAPLQTPLQLKPPHTKVEFPLSRNYYWWWSYQSKFVYHRNKFIVSVQKPFFNLCFFFQFLCIYVYAQKYKNGF